jgi:hypothetical protein
MTIALITLAILACCCRVAHHLAITIACITLPILVLLSCLDLYVIKVGSLKHHIDNKMALKKPNVTDAPDYGRYTLSRPLPACLDELSLPLLSAPSSFSCCRVAKLLLVAIAVFILLQSC